MALRVNERGAQAATPVEGADRHATVPSETGSALALETIELASGGRLTLADDALDTLLLLQRGSGQLELDGVSHALTGCCSSHVPAGRHATLHAGDDGLTCALLTVADNVDLHAPFGTAECVVMLEDADVGTATGARSFQILHGPHNGSVRATAFSGSIPPGKAPWHYHLYDEIVWVREGEGRLHVGEAIEDLGPGCAFRLHPREVHIVENTSADSPLEVVGFFTPAGSPSAAYLEPGIAATYAFS